MQHDDEEEQVPTEFEGEEYYEDDDELLEKFKAALVFHIEGGMVDVEWNCPDCFHSEDYRGSGEVGCRLRVKGFDPTSGDDRLTYVECERCKACFRTRSYGAIGPEYSFDFMRCRKGIDNPLLGTSHVPKSLAHLNREARKCHNGIFEVTKKDSNGVM